MHAVAHPLEVIIDGQAVMIPSTTDLESLRVDPDYMGLPAYTPGTRKLITTLIDFVLAHHDAFALGLHRVPHPANRWMPVVLLRWEDHWQRVHIEYPTCATCAWRGPIANPTEPSLYFGLPDERDILRRAGALPRMTCPRCNAELGRHALWVGHP